MKTKYICYTLAIAFNVLALLIMVYDIAVNYGGNWGLFGKPSTIFSIGFPYTFICWILGCFFYLSYLARLWPEEFPKGSLEKKESKKEN